MSCWCDGDDPGCETCHPTMVPEARADFRRLRIARVNLLGVAANASRADTDVVRYADDYREAVKQANNWNWFGTARRTDP